MNYIQIRFVQGASWDSKIIEWFSRWWTSHVELLIGDETFGAQLKGGINWRPLHARCYCKVKKTEVWQIPITEAQNELLGKLIADARGSKYDWPAIPSFMLGQFRLHLKGRWICSGFVAGVLQSLRLANISRPLENYEPQHIYDIVTQIREAEKL